MKKHFEMNLAEFHSCDYIWKKLDEEATERVELKL